MTVPKLTVSEKQDTDMRPIEELECISMDIQHVLLNPNDGAALAVIETEEKKVAYPLNSQEGTLLSFVRAGLSEHAHIQTIYQIHYSTMRALKFELKRAVIEAKQGDVYYARLVWEDPKGRRLFHSCSVGDAMILACLADAKMEIVKKVLEAMEPITDMSYHEQLEFDEE